MAINEPVIYSRSPSDDSILALVRIFGRFDDEVVWSALECLVNHAWNRGTVKDRAVQGDAIFGINLLF